MHVILEATTQCHGTETHSKISSKEAASTEVCPKRAEWDGRSEGRMGKRPHFYGA